MRGVGRKRERKKKRNNSQITSSFETLADFFCSFDVLVQIVVALGSHIFMRLSPQIYSLGRWVRGGEHECPLPRIPKEPPPHCYEQQRQRFNVQDRSLLADEMRRLIASKAAHQLLIAALRLPELLVLEDQRLDDALRLLA